MVNKPGSTIFMPVSDASEQFIAIMDHNIVLAMQAMGLGGLIFADIDRWSVLGALADQDIKGLGFQFVRDERWHFPNPVGLDGIYETLCPPYYPDMHAAVEAFAERKFGRDGAYLHSHAEHMKRWHDEK